MTPADAAAIGVEDKQIVNVKLDTPRALIFGDVVVRVKDSFALAMHIDTDESNAAMASGTVYGEIVK
jgi:putative phosphotransacetylase